MIRPMLILMAFLASPAFAADSCANYGYGAQSPWIAYGETALTIGQKLTDPAPNISGLGGEVTALPYTVPAGKILVLETMSVECMWGVNMYAVVGSAGDVNNNELGSYNCGTQNGTSGNPPTWTFIMPTKVWPVNDHLPAGTILHLILNPINIIESGIVHGWKLTGKLCVAP